MKDEGMELSGAALEAFGLSRVRFDASVTIPGGEWRAVSSDQGARLVRVLREGSLASLALEALLCAHLRSGGFPTLLPIPTSSGAHSVEWEGKRLSLFPMPAGEGRPASALSFEALERLGMALARFHHLANAFSAPLASFDLGPMRAPLEGLQRAGDARYGPLATKLLATLSAQGWGMVPEGPIIDGLEPSEVRWLADGVSELFGFHRVRRGPWVLDVAQVLVSFCLDAQGGDAARALLDGYLRVRSLSDDERRVLARLIPFAAALRVARRLADPRMREAVRPAEIDEVALSMETLLVVEEARSPRGG